MQKTFLVPPIFHPHEIFTLDSTLGSLIIDGKYDIGSMNICIYWYLCFFNYYYSVYNSIDCARSSFDALCLHHVHIFQEAVSIIGLPRISHVKLAFHMVTIQVPTRGVMISH